MRNQRCYCEVDGILSEESLRGLHPTLLRKTKEIATIHNGKWYMGAQHTKAHPELSAALI